MSDFAEEQDEKRRVYARERKQKSEQLIDDFGELVNGGIDSKAFQEKFCRQHRTLQQSMFNEILKLIIMISKDEYQTDGRNEYSKKTAKALILGYAEVIRNREIDFLINIGYRKEEAVVKAGKIVKRYLENPQSFLNLPTI